MAQRTYQRHRRTRLGLTRARIRPWLVQVRALSLSPSRGYHLDRQLIDDNSRWRGLTQIAKQATCARFASGRRFGFERGRLLLLRVRAR